MASRAGLAPLAAILALTGCAAAQDPAAQMSLFRNGQARMTCGLGCAFEYGGVREYLRYDEETGNWNGLAARVLAIGYDDDQSWYYLGRAAEGLGFGSAAKIYYTKALYARMKCDGFVNVCDGLDIPVLAQSGIDKVEAPAPGEDAAYTDVPPAPPDNAKDSNEIKLVSDGGVFEVPVMINGVLPLDFTVDSGASDVSIPADVALTLYRTGTLKDSDFLGTATYTLADGSTMPSTRFVIRTLRVGGRTVHDVDASIADVNGPLLLGESFLTRFHSWSIDNAANALILK